MDDIAKLRELIKGQKVAMLTTVLAEGRLHSRPMFTQQVDFDGDLWFFTRAHSPKVEEVEKAHQVSVTYADSSSDRYVAVTGTAELVLDKSKAKELWSPLLKAWFPQGLEDPEVALLKVSVERAEYWDVRSSKMVQLVGFVKATLTGEPFKPGDHGQLELNRPARH